MNKQEFIESISLEGEEWRELPDYEGIYAVSTLGRVASLPRKTDKNGVLHNKEGRIMCNHITKYGYEQVTLTKYNKSVNRYIHRLVALLFIENPNNYPQIDHIDGNKQNNRVANLRWCTQKMNNNYPLARLHNSLSHKGNRKIILSKSKTVVRINPQDPNDIKIYESPTFAKKNEGYNQGHISAVCLGKRNHHKGYKWIYLSDYQSQSQ